MSEVHSVAAIQLKRQDYTFGIVTPKRAYYVRASTAAESQEWIRALNDVKTQLSQRNTMTNDFADLQMSSVRDVGSPTSPTSTTSTARPLSTLDLGGERSHSAAQVAAATSAASAASAVAAGRPQHQQQPISINVPGRGSYTSPAQPRPIPTTPDALSPLTATTDSETGAEHYGLSYTSSMTGHSFGSSPGRDTSHGSELSDSGGPLQRRGSQRGQGSSSSQRRHEGSSGGEQHAGGAASSYQSAGGAVLSSSEEEDDVEEKEQLDRAMPLPTMAASQSGINAGTVGSTQQPTTASHSPAKSTPQAQGANVPIKAQSMSGSGAREGDLLLRDPNRVIVQGYLMKQSNRRKTWRKRWFVLTASRLMYTRSHMDSRAHRQIPLESILDAIEHASKKSYSGGSGTTAPSSPSLQQAQIGGSAVGFHSLVEGADANGGVSEGTVGSSGRRGSSGAVFATSPSGQAASLHEGAAVGSGGSGTASSQQPGAPPAKPERRQSVVAAAAAAAAAGVSSGLNLGSSSGSGGAAFSSGGNNNASGSSNSGAGGSSSHNPAKRMDNCFKIITPKRVFLLCAPTEEEEIKWLSALQALLTRSRGQHHTEGASTAMTVGSPGTQQAPTSTTLSTSTPAQPLSEAAQSLTASATSPRLA